MLIQKCTLILGCAHCPSKIKFPVREELSDVMITFQAREDNSEIVFLGRSKLDSDTCWTAGVAEQVAALHFPNSGDRVARDVDHRHEIDDAGLVHPCRACHVV